jgi:hypothetical protein
MSPSLLTEQPVEVPWQTGHGRARDAGVRLVLLSFMAGLLGDAGR